MGSQIWCSGAEPPALGPRSGKIWRFVTLGGRFVVKNDTTRVEPLRRFCRFSANHYVSTLGFGASARHHRRLDCRKTYPRTQIRRRRPHRVPLQSKKCENCKNPAFSWVRTHFSQPDEHFARAQRRAQRHPPRSGAFRKFWPPKGGL